VPRESYTLDSVAAAKTGGSNALQSFRAGSGAVVPSKNKDEIMLVKRKGPEQTAAFHYPHELLPREVAYRFPVDLLVEPLDKAEPQSLWPRLCGKVSFVVLFTGQPLAGVCTGLSLWRKVFEQNLMANSADTGGGTIGFEPVYDPYAELLKPSKTDTATDTASLNTDNANDPEAPPPNLMRRNKMNLRHPTESLGLCEDPESGQPALTVRDLMDCELNLAAGDTFGALRKEVMGKSFPETQFLQLHYTEYSGWPARRIAALLKPHLKAQVAESQRNQTFVFKGRWEPHLKEALQLFDASLPTCLLVDPRGYIRWHAVGLPSADAKTSLIRLCRKLRVEKRL